MSLGFTPRWYHERLGTDFGAEWHNDPGYRYEALVTMKEHLHECFPQAPYFTPRYRNGIEPTCATISGVHGIMLISGIYGLEIEYRVDNWPDARGGMTLTREELAANPEPDVESSPVFRALVAQMEEIERRWGTIYGYLNYQGILNIAVKLRGSVIFMDMYDDPEFARRLFTGIARTIERTSGRVQERQRRSGFPVNLLSMSNCVMNMISPEDYERFVLPLDADLSTKYERFGVHTCNWDATPYADKLRKIAKMGYLDTGKMADLERIRELFPDTRRAVLYSPVELEEKPLSEIKSDLRRIRDTYSPCDIVMADVESTAPDERVRAFLDLAAKLENE